MLFILYILSVFSTQNCLSEGHMIAVILTLSAGNPIWLGFLCTVAVMPSDSGAALYQSLARLRVQQMSSELVHVKLASLPSSEDDTMCLRWNIELNLTRNCTCMLYI